MHRKFFKRNRQKRKHTCFCAAAIVLCIHMAQGQQAVSLDSCLAWTESQYPLTKQKAYIASLGENNSDAIRAAWLPQIASDIKATYQSEVTSFDFPGFPTLIFPKDDYNFGLSLSQTLYDGGVTAQQENINMANTAVALEKNEVDLYQLKSKVLQIYGNILLAKENMRILQSYLETLQSREKSLKSQVQNGVMLQSNLSELQVEALNTQQKMTENASGLSALYQTLSLLTGKTFDDSTHFETMQYNGTGNTDSLQRPELRLFTLQKSALEEHLKLSQKQLVPQLAFFADGAYGRPGYNFLDQSFRLYGIAGLTLKWNIASVYNLSYERKNYTLNTDMVDVQEALFRLGINSELIKENAEITKWQALITSDAVIVEKRKEIVKSAADQLDNGLITSSDYITELSAEKQAELNEDIHVINRDIAIWNYHITKGN